MFLAVLQFDTYLGLVLDMPAFIDPESLEPGAKSRLRPSSAARTPSSLDTATDTRSAFVASAKHLELLTLTATGLRNVFVKDNQRQSYGQDRDSTTVDIKKLSDLEHEFRKWARALPSLQIVSQRPEISAL